MAVKDNTLRLHQDIRKEFEKLSNVREYGVQKYSNQYILCAVGHKFYKSAKTVENIVFNRTVTAHSSLKVQPDLFATEL